MNEREDDCPMTRKDFEALAAALKVARPSHGFWEKPNLTALRAWQSACMAVMDVCYSRNPRFDYARFGQACGYSLDEDDGPYCYCGHTAESHTGRWPEGPRDATGYCYGCQDNDEQDEVEPEHDYQEAV